MTHLWSTHHLADDIGDTTDFILEIGTIINDANMWMTNPCIKHSEVQCTIFFDPLVSYSIILSCIVLNMITKLENRANYTEIAEQTCSAPIAAVTMWITPS